MEDQRVAAGRTIQAGPCQSGERAAAISLRVSGYRRAHHTHHRRPLIRSNTHVPDHPIQRPRLRHWFDRSRRSRAAILPRPDFHDLSRAVSQRARSRCVLDQHPRALLHGHTGLQLFRPIQCVGFTTTSFAEASDRYGWDKQRNRARVLEQNGSCISDPSIATRVSVAPERPHHIEGTDTADVRSSRRLTSCHVGRRSDTVW